MSPARLHALHQTVRRVHTQGKAPNFEKMQRLVGHAPLLKILTLELSGGYCLIATPLGLDVARLPALTSWLTVVSQLPFCVVPPSTTQSVLGMM